MRNRLAQQVALAMAIGAGMTGVASGEARQPLRISVTVVTNPKVPAEVLALAKAEATRIYAALGIDLTWHGEPDPAGAHLTIRIIEKAIKEAGPTAMGVAPRDRNGMGRLLYAFYDRVEAFARQHDKPIAQILGHVMAHEMGHLLLPHGSHSKSGIMLAGWDRTQVEQIGRGWLSFSTDEAAQIRRTATALRTGP